MAAFSSVRIDPPGASNALLVHIMEQAGYKVEFSIIPSKRMQYMLRSGDVDAMQVSGLARHYRQAREGSDGFVQSHYPVVTFPVTIYYRKSASWRPTWPLQGNFKEGLRGASKDYTYLNAAGLNLTKVPSFRSGASMVNYQRLDYWMDVMYFPADDEDVRQLNDPAFANEKFFDAPMFMLFRDDEEGRAMRDAWDEGFRELLLNPEKYAEVYLAQLPKQYFTPPMESFLGYIRENYPEFRQAGDPPE